MLTSRAAASATLRADRAARLGAQAGAVLFATALTGAASQVSVTLPGSVVPFTLQPLAVLLAGAVLGSRLGALSQALYLAAGVAGASMFAWSPVLLPGIARLLGPTGGFLLAFPAAAFVAGLAADRGLARRPLGAAAAMLAGGVVLYAGGAAWLAASAPVAVWSLVPYAAADAVKVVIASAAVPSLRRLLAR
ncbi:MAG: biotin transporter BioY [Vicinamibacterales bacterium]